MLTHTLTLVRVKKKRTQTFFVEQMRPRTGTSNILCLWKLKKIFRILKNVMKNGAVLNYLKLCKLCEQPEREGIKTINWWWEKYKPHALINFCPNTRRLWYNDGYRSPGCSYYSLLFHSSVFIFFVLNFSVGKAPNLVKLYMINHLLADCVCNRKPFITIYATTTTTTSAERRRKKRINQSERSKNNTYKVDKNRTKNVITKNSNNKWMLFWWFFIFMKSTADGKRMETKRETEKVKIDKFKFSDK